MKGLNGRVAKGEVGAGIRERCPLSPCLFIMILTAILQDVDTALFANGTLSNTWSIKHPMFDLEYVDDTLRLGLTTQQLESGKGSNFLRDAP